MVLVSSGLLAYCSFSGVGIPYLPKAQVWIRRANESRIKDYNKVQVQFVSSKIPNARIQHTNNWHVGSRHVASVGKSYPGVRSDDNIPSVPFLLSLIKEVIWYLRSLIGFLAEQPGQLRYIEWPSFQSTLKTATLTLVLVALLIVALSSVDATLSYILALLLRKTS